MFGQDQTSYQPAFEKFIDTLHMADRDRVRARLEQAICDSASFEYDARIVTPAGEVRNVITKG
ncbi:MAG: PAS domain-containing protein [Rhodospirillaceae bacterium]